MGSLGQALSSVHVSSMVRAMRKQQPDLLLISAEDGQKIAGHRSLLCLFSSTFAKLLSEHDQGEGILKVFLEVSSIGLFAFHRMVKSGGIATEKDWILAEETLRLLNVQITPEPWEFYGNFRMNGETSSNSYEDFLRDSFIKHENDKSEDEEKKFARQEKSSKVALAKSLQVHRPDLVLIAEDGNKILGHRSLLSLFSPVFRQLLPSHDQHESLLAVSMPFRSDALFAFHRIYESGGRTEEGDWTTARDILKLMAVDIEYSPEIVNTEQCNGEQPENDSIKNILNVQLKVDESSDKVKNEMKNEQNDVHNDNDFIDDDEDDDFDDGYYEKKNRPRKEKRDRSESSGREWKCKHCNATFSSRSTRYRHQILHEEAGSKVKDGDVKNEVEEEDIEEDDWTDDAGDTKKKGGGVKKVKKMVDNKKIYTCKKCQQTFKQRPAYLQHKLSHGDDDEEEDSAEDGEETKSDEKPFVCDLCTNAQFKRKSSLVKHRIVDHGQVVTCEHCPQQFDNPVTWTKHVKSHRTAQCDICAKMFTEVQLRVHKRLNHEQAKKQCPMCPAKVQMLRVHMENCHTGELRTCTACPFTSRRKADIDVHYRKMHTDLNKETCHGCGEVFKKLKAHLLRTKCGTGFKAEANVPCPHCPKMFTHKMGVDKHINAIHLQIKNKHCQFCDYRTYNMFNLNLHIANRHKGEKMEKQQCMHCDKVVMSMDWHLKIYHPEMYHPGM